MTGRTFMIGEIFTVEEIKKALAIWSTDRTNFHRRALAEIVEPAMDRINETTGQENDARYLAYALQFVVVSYPS